MRYTDLKNLIKFIVYNFCNALNANRYLSYEGYFRFKYDLSIFTYFDSGSSTYGFYGTNIELTYNEELIKVNGIPTLLKNRLKNIRYADKQYYIFNLDEEKLIPLDKSSNMRLLSLSNVLNKRFRKDTIYFISMHNISSECSNFLRNIKNLFMRNKYEPEFVFEIIDNIFPVIETMFDKFHNIKFNLAVAFSSNIYERHKQMIESFVNYVKTLNYLRFDDFYYDLAYTLKNKIIEDENNIFTALIEQINKNLTKKILVKNSFSDLYKSNQYVIELIDRLSLTHMLENVTDYAILFKPSNSINIKDFVFSIVFLNNALFSL